MDCGPILVVDDDAATSDLVSSLLEVAGFSATVVETGEDALVAAGEARPSLVVLDVHLPTISGYEVCRQLRERFGQRLPIVFLSGDRTEPHDRVAGLLLGADDYVTKPFFPEELVARIRRLLIVAGTQEEEEDGEAEAPSTLTNREQQVLALLAEGLSQEAIANELYISPKTVATHIQRTLAKLGVHSRAAAVARAYQLGLVHAEVESHLFVPEPSAA